MAKVQIWVELSDEHLHKLSDAAEHKGVPVERLVEQTVKKLIEENEREEHDGTDHPIVMC
jgi:low affinity Fe/Cu permease